MKTPTLPPSRISAEMPREEERKALIEKATELSMSAAEIEAKLKDLPEGEQTEPVRKVMEELASQIRRMEKNLQKLSRHD